MAIKSEVRLFILNCLVWCPGQNKRIAPLFIPWMSLKATKGLALTTKIDCNKTAIGLPTTYHVCSVP
jgi:hypothetical protein